MSVRVVARVRPLLKHENEKDTIVSVSGAEGDEINSNTASKKTADNSTTIRIPNPRNNTERFSFRFNSVYDHAASQQVVYDNEVAPTVKHLFNGFDVTIFAYGVTGTGKTHTMRGGKSLHDRGVIPRLLSGIYRRARKAEKDAAAATEKGENASTARIRVVMSYYEIYNDKVFDLFEGPEKRTAAGLPIRDCNGKTVVVGLSERECGSLKEFETMYDRANVNRSTSATKLNAHSSRSHAILSVKIVQTKGEETRISTVSAIDLAGSEDNRRTENGKERMTESACINKSLFALAQCVDAIRNKHSRIPYRESKMTRILSLGQNKGYTIMILNISPLRSYHLDTLSSLNFANRTKKIETREIENEPIAKAQKSVPSTTGSSVNRQPLRVLTTAHNLHINNARTRREKPAKEFSVFSDKTRLPSAEAERRMNGKKRSLDNTDSLFSRPAKSARANINSVQAPAFNEERFLALVERRVDQVLAERGMPKDGNAEKNTNMEEKESEVETQTRLRRLEKLVAKHEDAHAGEGLQYLLMARQQTEKGDNHAALDLYRAALPFFPNMDKLPKKIASLERKIHKDTNIEHELPTPPDTENERPQRKTDEEDSDYVPEESTSTKTKHISGKGLKPTMRPLSNNKDTKIDAFHPQLKDLNFNTAVTQPHSPRTSHILRIINTRDIAQIRALRGVGAKKAETIVRCLCEMDDRLTENNGDALVTGLRQLGDLKGVGAKTVENMRNGFVDCEIV